MKLIYLQKPSNNWYKKLPKSEKHPRSWQTTEELEIQLSDGSFLVIPKDTIWDGSSIPKWFWWLFKPIDEGALADLIHDELWEQKNEQLKRFDYKIYDCRKFADKERLKWRNSLAPEKPIKNLVTHIFIRLIGGFFYAKQCKIPE